MEQIKLFDTDEYVDSKIAKIMENGRCGTCEKRVQPEGGGKSYCKKRKSGRTEWKLMRVRINQPACIWYEKKITKK